MTKSHKPTDTTDTPSLSRRSIIAGTSAIGLILATGSEPAQATPLDAIDATDYTVLGTGTTQAQRLGDVVGDLNSVRAFGTFTNGANITAPLQAALNAMTYVDIPPGNYTIDTVYVPSGRTVNNRATLSGTINVMGSTRQRAGIHHAGRVNGSGSLAAGATTLTGSFGGFSAGNLIMVGLQGAGDPVTNQSGYDFTSIASVSGTGLTLTQSLRWAYADWYVAKVVGKQLTGDLLRGTNTINQDFTAFFQQGDLVRVENMTGTDTIWTETGQDINPSFKKAYFELVRVKSISTTAIVFEQEIAYSHSAPWLIKMDPASNVRITGGYISRLVAAGADTLSIENVRCAELSINYSVGVQISGIRVDGNVPRVCGFSSIRDATISDIVTRGAAGSTDNGAFKMMAPINVTVNGVSSFDTNSTSTTQGIYPFFVDFFYTPYSGWAQSTSVSSLTLSKPKAGVGWSFWAVGTRDCQFSDIVAQGGIRISRSLRCNVNALSTSGQVQFELVRDGSRASAIMASFLVITGCRDLSVHDGSLRGGMGTNDGAAVKIHPALIKVNAVDTLVPSQKIILQDIRNRSTTAADVSFRITGANEVHLDGCADLPGLAKSVSFFGTPTTTLVSYGLNRFQNPVDTPASMRAAEVRSDLVLTSSSWQATRLVLGGTYLWVDSAGRLRIKSGAPTSDTDGTIVGAQS